MKVSLWFAVSNVHTDFISNEGELGNCGGKRRTERAGKTCYPFSLFSQAFFHFRHFFSILLKSGNNTSYVGVTFAWCWFSLVILRMLIRSLLLESFPFFFMGFFFFTASFPLDLYAFPVFYGCLFIDPFGVAAPRGWCPIVSTCINGKRIVLLNLVIQNRSNKHIHRAGVLYCRATSLL